MNPPCRHVMLLRRIAKIYLVFEEKSALKVFSFQLRRPHTSSSGSSAAPAAPLAASTPKIVGYWLGGIAVMAWGAVALGGVTRLTESGLSMVSFEIKSAPK